MPAMARRVLAAAAGVAAKATTVSGAGGVDTERGTRGVRWASTVAPSLDSNRTCTTDLHDGPGLYRHRARRLGKDRASEHLCCRWLPVAAATTVTGSARVVPQAQGE